MRLSIQRLRWVLLGGALLLVAVLTVYIGYGRYRAMRAYRRIVARSGVSISRDSNGVTYSQSVGGKKIFTLRADKETSLGAGRWKLHDADLLLYTRDPNHPDQIYGKEFEYDETQQVARALGEVFMDLQPPQVLEGSDHVPSKLAGKNAGARPVIHVRTSGLVYQRKAGIAATDNQVEFQYGGMQCTSLGAVFDTAENILHLRSHVTMSGQAHGQPVQITAAQADLDRGANTANLTQPVLVSEDRRARSDRALLWLRPDGSIEQAQGVGDVVLSSGTRQVMSARLDATLSPQSVPETAKLSGGVVLTDSSVQRPMNGAARQVDATFNEQGEPTRLVATGAARASMVDHTGVTAGAHGLERQIEGEKIRAEFVPGLQKGSPRLSLLQSTGTARMQGDSVVGPGNQSNAGSSNSSLRQYPVPGSTPTASALRTPALRTPVADAVASPAQIKTVQVAADDLRIQFVAGRGNQVQPSRLDATGHTALQQDAPGGEQEITRGDSLDASFSPAVEMRQPGSPSQLTIVSAVQAGHVTVYRRSAKGGDEETSTGSAQRAVYDGSSRDMTLSGETELASGNVSLRAPTVLLDQQSGDLEARGGVQTTIVNAAPGQAGAARAPVQGEAAAPNAAAVGKREAVTHVLSAVAILHHATKLSEFRGSDAEPARMWQNASQVQAAVLVMDGMQHTFSARPAAPGALVHAVFAAAGPDAGHPTPGQAGSGPAESGPAESGQSGSGQAGPGQVSGRQAEEGPSASARSGARSSKTGRAISHQEPADSYVRVTSPKLDYNDLRREATFSGGVRIDGTAGEVRGQRAAVFLTPAPTREGPGGDQSRLQGAAQPSAIQPDPLNASLERVVVSGDVQMEQPGRRGTGEQLLYTAASDSYVLTGSAGHPPHVEDAQQGSVTGATLIFGRAGSTIVVAGQPATPKAPTTRVRTETEVRQ